MFWIGFLPFTMMVRNSVLSEKPSCFSVAYFSYRFADRKALQGNEFNFEPIREVAFIFIGIFGTMMPALELVGTFAQSEEGAAMITYNSLYWGTGFLSGFP